MNTRESLQSAAEQSQRQLTVDDLRGIIQAAAPDMYNGITIDAECPVLRRDYCHIRASAQQVTYRTKVLTFNCHKDVAAMLAPILEHNDTPYAILDEKLKAEIDKSPRRGEGLMEGTRLRIEELRNGGRAVAHAEVELTLDDGNRLSATQPTFIVREASSVARCRVCNGRGSAEYNAAGSPMLTTQYGECPECDGLGHMATVTTFTPQVTNRQATLTRCEQGEIEGLDENIIASHAMDGDTSCVRMETHLGGIDEQHYDSFVTPYLDALRDKLGEENAIVDLYYRIIPCLMFRYRSVIGGTAHVGIVVDPFGRCQVLPDFEGSGRLRTGLSNAAKGISRWLGRISKSTAHKERQDVIRSARLLIAVAIADGLVHDEEKVGLMHHIAGSQPGAGTQPAHLEPTEASSAPYGNAIEGLTSAERDKLIALLASGDTSFLTDDDFHFNSAATAQLTLSQLQELAASDGHVHDKESEIIERLEAELKTSKKTH